MLNESGEVLSFRTFGGVTDETLQNITAGAAAGLYHLYNLNEFKKYSASKLKDEQEAKRKAEYQKFLTERRRKRYVDTKDCLII